jgi:two-component system OmpR family sensor kinase
VALQRLTEGVRRSTHLVQQLLTLARQEPGSAPSKSELVDLRTLAQQVAVDFEPLARDKSIDLILDLQPTVVPGEAEGLRVMLNNLVDNAIRYTRAGGQVKLAVRRGDAGSILEVEDTGPGIPEDQRTRVFDRFYRATGTGSAGGAGSDSAGGAGSDSAGGAGSDSEGSGLGLAIVKRVVDRHAGRIELGTGSAGVGLRVTVRLPS